MPPTTPPEGRVCECHGEAMQWHRDAKRKAGGRWQCAVKGRAAKARYNASPKGRAATARYKASAKWRATRRAADARYKASPKGRARDARYYAAHAPERIYAVGRRKLRARIERKRERIDALEAELRERGITL